MDNFLSKMIFICSPQLLNIGHRNDSHTKITANASSPILRYSDTFLVLETTVEKKKKKNRVFRESVVSEFGEGR